MLTRSGEHGTQAALPRERHADHSYVRCRGARVQLRRLQLGVRGARPKFLAVHPTTTQAEMVRGAGKINRGEFDAVRVAGRMRRGELEVVRVAGRMCRGELEVVRVAGRMCHGELEVVRVAGRMCRGGFDAVLLVGKIVHFQASEVHFADKIWLFCVATYFVALNLRRFRPGGS